MSKLVLTKIIMILLLSGGFCIQINRINSESVTTTDNFDDYICVEGSKTGVKSSLKPLDIVKVEVENDDENFIITIVTREPLPSKGPAYPESYMCQVAVMADHDGTKFVSVSYIIDDFGWNPLFLANDRSDAEENIRYRKTGNILIFTFNLDMKDWGSNPKTLSCCVRLGYELGAVTLGGENIRVYDFVPDQAWEPGGSFEYLDHELIFQLLVI